MRNHANDMTALKLLFFFFNGGECAGVVVAASSVMFTLIQNKVLWIPYVVLNINKLFASFFYSNIVGSFTSVFIIFLNM